MAAEGRAPLVDFCNRNDPRAQLRNRPNPAHHARGRPLAQLSSFHAPRYMKRSAGGRASRHSQPRFHGPEACEGLRRREASPRRDRSRWRLHPNPIDPDTSCRQHRGDAGRSNLHRRNAPNGASCYALADEPRLRRTRPQGRLTRPPAKEATIRRTRGAFHQRTTPRGAGSFPQTVPSLWIGDRAPFRSHTIATRDGDAKREDSGSLEQPAREPA